ncbi:MAG: hypothetical protein LBP62_00985 [Clostridiales bacterium]|nr:hypothetical protein [Clostridiales bacterium]
MFLALFSRYCTALFGGRFSKCVIKSGLKYNSKSVAPPLNPLPRRGIYLIFVFRVKLRPLSTFVDHRL